jgi:hypothetical protein
MDMGARSWVFNSVVNLTNGLRSGGITLSSLNIYAQNEANPFFYQDYLKGLTQMKDADYPAVSLQVLATHSGGQVPISGFDLAAEISDATRDADAYYRITFDPAAGATPNEYHSLAIKVDKPGVTVRSPSGYYANTMLVYTGRDANKFNPKK